MVDFCAVGDAPSVAQQSYEPVGPAQAAVAESGSAAPPDAQPAGPADVIAAQTIDFDFWQRAWKRYWQRRKLRFWAWFARSTRAGERLLLFSWSNSHKDFNRFFVANSYRFGEKLGAHVHGDLKDHLGKFLEGDGEPFLIVKGIFSRKFPQLSLARKLKMDPTNPSCRVVGEEAEKLLDKRRYNLIAAGLIAATGTELRFKQPGQLVYRDYITTPKTEKNQFVEGGDLTLYYRTATPEQAPDVSGGAGKAARVILFACIENPIADPIYLIRADEVISRLTSEQRRLLSDDTFFFFDNWNPQSLGPARINKAKHILYAGSTPEEVPWLSFDPNRIWTEYDRTTPAHRQALVALMAKIRQVGIDSARKIVLQRGDALLVDNYRALTRRYEHGYHNLHFYPPYGPLLRWLRVFYGFPR